MFALSYVVNGCSIQTAVTSDWFEIGLANTYANFSLVGNYFSKYLQNYRDALFSARKYLTLVKKMIEP